MKITGIKTFLMRAGPPRNPLAQPSADATPSFSTGQPDNGTRHWLFVKVTTDEGITGIGEGSGWPVVVEAAVRDLAPVVIDEDPADIERLWQKMFVAQMGHGQTGTVGAGAITAIETALWDIKGKVLGTPVWNLLGGKMRDRIRVYGHASTPEQARAYVEMGYTALKTGGVHRVPEKVARLRDALGPEIDLMLDLHGAPWLTTKDAMIIGRSLEQYRPLFWEDPVAPENIDGLRRLRDAVAIPLAAGERWANIWGLNQLLGEGLVDVVQPDTGRSGGISQMKKIAAMAEARFITVAPHAGSLGPVAEYAAIHVMAAIPNALVLERFALDWEPRERVIDPSPEIVDGHVIVPTAPGLGVDIVEEEVAKYPPGHNVAVRGTAKVNAYEAGTFREAVYVQTRWQRQSVFPK
ncbi:L-alanine-DL-glutamate epimerase [Devosia enhydra]|uniref:L-alanine-DL-glutamate epimerase n=1 Tax=Devosia enhydra TaxID=665118 RepID=A0A1K2HUA0_9HYPH|nr:mandelate racemase/muconate lactonizing enzyme family protein [Devosia enhydra]SFZ81956.1 L-alanine-DL-glutamate epimerase [Devosia enhydra]